jgi:hypothetical protein
MDIKGATILSERLAPHARVDWPRADVDASALPIYRWCGVVPAPSAAVAVPVEGHDGRGKRRRFMFRLLHFRGWPARS